MLQRTHARGELIRRLPGPTAGVSEGCSYVFRGQLVSSFGCPLVGVSHWLKIDANEKGSVAGGRGSGSDKVCAMEWNSFQGLVTAGARRVKSPRTIDLPKP